MTDTTAETNPVEAQLDADIMAWIARAATGAQEHIRVPADAVTADAYSVSLGRMDLPLLSNAPIPIHAADFDRLDALYRRISHHLAMILTHDVDGMELNKQIAKVVQSLNTGRDAILALLPLCGVPRKLLSHKQLDARVAWSALANARRFGCRVGVLLDEFPQSRLRIQAIVDAYNAQVDTLENLLMETERVEQRSLVATIRNSAVLSLMFGLAQRIASVAQRLEWPDGQMPHWYRLSKVTAAIKAWNAARRATRGRKKPVEPA